MKEIWKSTKELIVDFIDDNCFLFKFQGRGDIDHVLEGRPWFFKRHLLSLNEVGPKAQPRNMMLETTPLWLHLYDLPISTWRESIVQKLAGRVGSVSQVCYRQAREIRGRYARIRIELSIAKF